MGFYNKMTVAQKDFANHCNVNAGFIAFSIFLKRDIEFTLYMWQVYIWRNYLSGLSSSKEQGKENIGASNMKR